MTAGSAVVLDGAPGTALRNSLQWKIVLPSEPVAPGGALRFRLSFYEGNKNMLADDTLHAAFSAAVFPGERP